MCKIFKYAIIIYVNIYIYEYIVNNIYIYKYSINYIICNINVKVCVYVCVCSELLQYKAFPRISLLLLSTIVNILLISHLDGIF